MTDALDQLLELLDLEQIEVNIFRGRSPDETRQRVFGGQVFTAEGELVVSVVKEGLIRLTGKPRPEN